MKRRIPSSTTPRVPTWEDTSSYSQGTKEQIPHTFTLRTGQFTLVVTRHRMFAPDEWTMACYDTLQIGVGVPRPLKSKDIEEAKKEALQIAAEVVQQCMDSINMALNNKENT